MNTLFRHGHERTFGTFPLKGGALHQAVSAAAETGYRSFDTAQMYGNEAETGEALAATGLAREAFCLTTKVHPDHFSESAFLPSVEESLKRLRVDRVDILMLHWPPADGDISPSLKLLARARREGLTREIAISNYTARMMRDAASLIDEPIVANQVEFHPLLDQSALLAAATETGIPLASYCSVARGAVFEHPEFAAIGERYDKSAAQVVLRWILQKGVPITTMSTKRANMETNFDVMGFTLSSVDMARIDAKTATGLRVVTADLVPWAPDWD